MTLNTELGAVIDNQVYTNMYLNTCFPYRNTLFVVSFHHYKLLINFLIFQVFNGSIPRRVFDRLLYITCSQNWEAMGSHFWIKQCIEVS